MTDTALPSRTRAEPLFYEGVALMSAGDLPRAAERFRQACATDPGFGEAYINLGLALSQMGSPDEAEVAYRCALQLRTPYPEIFLNLGALALARQDFATALEVLSQGIQEHPESAALWTNLGVLHASQKREAEAEDCYRAALRLDPAHASASASFNLAYVLLRQGRLEEGFACLEARDWYQHFTVALSDKLGIPRWQGEPLAGRAILIVCEAGHGDMIQFCRYASELKTRGARRVDILCHPGLQRLFAHLDGADTIYALGQDVPGTDWDVWSPPLSLPRYCSTTLQRIPARIPYLHVPPPEQESWRQHLPADGLRVGLVWKGGARFENDAHRSIPHLTRLAPLWAVSGVHFISLQKGQGEDEIRTVASACPMTVLGPALNDFADTAAVIANLDLVISVDTGVAHLAGAMGIPCWVLLPDYQTDWRWLKDRANSPWYPVQMRLFRQPAPHAWDAVVREVSHALEDFARRHIELQPS